MSSPKLITAGSTFGRLTATPAFELRSRSDGRNRIYQTFLCACGSETSIPAYSVLSGNTSSCGCLHSEIVSAQMKTHGLSKTSSYRVALNKARRLQKKASSKGVEVVQVKAQDLERLLNDSNNECWVCGVTLQEVCWDHIQPLSKGGPHAITNLKPSCRSCNSRKGASWPFTDKMKSKIAKDVRALRTPQGHTILVSDGKEVSA